VIKFLEARFGTNHDLIETNITPWRRAVVGDLTSAFDFERPEQWRDHTLPSTEPYTPDLQARSDFPLDVPSTQTMPQQERGVRAARPLPYDMEATGEGVGNYFKIDFNNVGRQTVVFHARSAQASDLPQCYTVDPGQSLMGLWPLAPNSTYDVSVY